MITFDGMIIAATGCAAGDVDEIAELMRSEACTLDNLPRRQFNALARRAYKALPEYRALSTSK